MLRATAGVVNSSEMATSVQHIVAQSYTWQDIEPLLFAAHAEVS